MLAQLQSDACKFWNSGGVLLAPGIPRRGTAAQDLGMVTVTRQRHPPTLRTRYHLKPDRLPRQLLSQSLTSEFSQYVNRPKCTLHLWKLSQPIEACGKLLAKHFPPRRHDANELPNHLIVLDAR